MKKFNKVVDGAYDRFLNEKSDLSKNEAMEKFQQLLINHGIEHDVQDNYVSVGGVVIDVLGFMPHEDQEGFGEDESPTDIRSALQGADPEVADKYIKTSNQRLEDEMRTMKQNQI